MNTKLLAYDVRLARKLCSVNASLLFSFFQAKAIQEGNEFKASSTEIEKETYLTRRQQVKARQILVGKGYLIEKKKGMPSTLHFVVSYKEELKLPEPKRRPTFDAVPLDLRGSITRDAVLGGAYDERAVDANTRDLSLMELMLTEWATAWGKNINKLTLNAERKKIWKKAMKDKVTPSLFLKAIWGMKHDPWTERKNRCGWTYVFRHLERWVELFDEHGFETQDLSSMKKIKGVTVPIDYAWDQNDEHLLQLGNRFDPMNRKWVSKNSPKYESLLKYNNGEDKNEYTGKKSWRST